jgi:hypothetical protein
MKGESLAKKLPYTVIRGEASDYFLMTNLQNILNNVKSNAKRKFS